MVLGKFPVKGRPTIWMIVGQGPIALAVGASGGCLDIFTLLYLFSPLSPSLWETARYRLKYCLKGPLNPKQPTNQHKLMFSTRKAKTQAILQLCILTYVGWSGGAMVLGKLPMPGRPTIWMIVRQGPIALAVGAGGGLFGFFYSPLSFLSSFSLSLGGGPI